MALEFVKLFKGASPVSQVGNYGFFQLSTQSAGGGGEVEFSRVFSENSPVVISQVGAEIAKNNMTSSQVAETYGWNIGDTKDITLSTGETIQMRIIGFNHDTLSDGSGTAGITLEMVNCLNSTYIMNAENTNAGGYPLCTMRNTTLPEIKLTLPQEWQDVVVPVGKQSANGGANSYTETLTTSEELFLLSVVELSGSASIAQAGLTEGTRYEYYQINNSTSARKKNKGYWLRSATNNHDSNYLYCSGGNFYGWSANGGGLFSIAFAFCVGSASDSTGGGESGGTVVEEVQNDTGTTLNITATNYTETLNEQNGYTLDIGG